MEKPRAIIIKIGIANNKIAQDISMKGVDENSIQDVFMLIGIFDNLRNLMHDKLKKRMDISS